MRILLALTPLPKGRVRSRIVTLKNGKQFVNHYTPADTRDFEKALRHLLSGQDKTLGPVELRLSFRLPRPKSVPVKKRRWPCVKPDLDNLEKSFSDAAQDVIFENDGVICRKVSEKIYCDPDEWPSIEVEVLPMLAEQPALFEEDES